ncbi:MAG: ATP-binding cassette domain-containing protein, partial [Bacillota bacterium]|nr:ATP-binding cassette domain-containing protein [Bacillota bacterium]
MLELKNVNVHYGMIHALKDISLTVNDGEIVTLIGANGAGKTSTLCAISGLVKASGGTITLDGKELNKVAAPKRVGMGVSQIPEGRHVFPAMSVMENLEMGAYLRKDKSEIKKDMDGVFERFPILGERRKQAAGTLSGGEQQMLAMGRA